MTFNHPKNAILSVIILLISHSVIAEKKDSIKVSGFRFGALPAISFNTDLGFQYGALTNLYWYGDGSNYPSYNHSLYLEASKYTGGSTLLRAYYDSPKAFKNTRSTFDITYVKDQKMDFFGFNGNQATYDKAWKNENSPKYISRVFFNHQRAFFRIMANFKGKLLTNNNHIHWITGGNFFNTNIKSVDIEELNEAKSGNKILPDTAGLYDLYTQWGIISQEESQGGNLTYLKAGVDFDSRNSEANPSKGCWSEIIFSFSPAFLSSHNTSFSRFTMVHRQYHSLLPDHLIFAYRIGFQQKLFGTVPFYLLPHITSSTLIASTYQGLGGAQTLRGILRNKVVGDGIAFANLELRWKLFKCTLFKQNFYLATNLFSDIGIITKKYPIDLNKIPYQERTKYFSDDTQKPHISIGMGLKAALNENFIVSADYGKATNKQDGTHGFYITLNYLF